MDLQRFCHRSKRRPDPLLVQQEGRLELVLALLPVGGGEGGGRKLLDGGLGGKVFRLLQENLLQLDDLQLCAGAP